MRRPQNKLEYYDFLVERNPNFERKGKKMPYTSANGYMFSQLNKDGELGIRFSEERKKQLLEELETTVFKSYGAVMKGYVLIPESLLNDLERLDKFLQESFEYVMSLPKK